MCLHYVSTFSAPHCRMFAGKKSLVNCKKYTFVSECYYLLIQACFWFSTFMANRFYVLHIIRTLIRFLLHWAIANVHFWNSNVIVTVILSGWNTLPQAKIWYWRKFFFKSIEIIRIWMIFILHNSISIIKYNFWNPQFLRKIGIICRRGLK